jgi:hypothetical protein
MSEWGRGWWLPTVVVVMFAWVNGTMPENSECPAGVDGPQFRCWLDEHPEQLPDCFARSGDGQCTAGTDSLPAGGAP